MSVPDDILDRLAALPYPEARAMVRSGDILLCSATDAGSRAIRWATRSAWSHVALAFRVPGIDRVLALECVQTIGVRAVPLSEFLSRTSSGQHPYPGRILLARHSGLVLHEDHSTMRAMTEFAFDRLGAKFSNAETARIALRIAMGRLNVRIPDRLAAEDEYICSEYVARCFEAVGLAIEWDGLGFIAPSDIADDARVQPVAQIQTVDFKSGASG